jgi:hypothetical protein
VGWAGSPASSCGVGHDTYRNPARIDQVHRDSADALRKLRHLDAGDVGQTHHVRGVRGAERGTDVPRPCTASYDDARRAGVGAAQLELVGGVAHRDEPERPGELLGPAQIRLLELEPGQVENLDHGVLRTPRVLPLQCALLAVQVAVCAVVGGGHRCSSVSY